MDDALRQKLASHSSPVPEDMWSRIQAGRKKNRIHPLGWYFFSASILLVGIIAGWLSFGHSSSRMTASDQHLMELSGEQAAANQVKEDQAVALSDEMTDQSANVTQPTSPARAEATKSDVDKATSTHSSSTRQSTQNDQSSASSAQQSVVKSSSTSQKVTTTTKKLDHQASSVKSAGNDRSARHETANIESLARTSGQANQPVARSHEPDVVEVDYRFATTDLLQGDKTGDVSSLTPLKLPGANMKSKKKGVPSCYSFNSFLRGISVDAYFAPEYASRQLVYKDPSMIGYAEQRNDDESYVFAYSAGFRANAHFKGGLALRTGLIYTDIVERLRYRDENAQVTKVINVTLDTIYQNGNIVYVWDTLSVTEYGNYNRIGYNRYRFYDIPLMLGYEIDRDRWVIQLNTGILFNVAASQRGDFLDPDHQLVNFDSNDDQAYRAFRTRVGSSLMMSLGFNYALRPKLHLLLEPQLRVWLQPMNIQAYPIDQKYVNLGLAMGIRNYF